MAGATRPQGRATISVHSPESGNPALTHNWVPASAGTNGIEEGARHRPYSLRRRVRRRLDFPSRQGVGGSRPPQKSARGWSAGWRYRSLPPDGRQRALRSARSPPGAPRAAVLGTLGRSSGRRRGPPLGPRSGAAPAAPSSPPRNSLKAGAAGLRAGGRLCGASRGACVRSTPAGAALTEAGRPASAPAGFQAPHLRHLPDRAAPPQDRL
jgi:hypothetical protein